MSIPWWRSFVLRFVGIYTLVFVTLVLISIQWLHALNQREVIDRFGLALESIAATAALSIPGDDLADVMTNADAGRPGFVGVRAQLEAVARENHLGADQIYILRPHPEQPGTFTFVVMLQERTFVGDPYVPPAQVSALYRWVMAERDAVRTPLFTDAHGTFISGLAPVVDSSGRAVAILQVDYGLDKYLMEVHRFRDMLLLGLLALSAALAVIGGWMYVYMRRKVVAVLSGTQAIAQENFDHRVEVPGRDELATIAHALNRVLSRLKERFEMLKFLPRHTAQMIERASTGQGVRLDISRRVRVAILESDIRGFTTISEQMSPEQVIQMLNTYIKSQAEWIEAFGGSIDKYMGDAVLAVFDGDRCESDALECALAIQWEVKSLNEAGAFAVPVGIGVGLAVGEVVMGNMGSEQRMEHTVIGPTVNLAARLCSSAQAGEVVVEARLWEAAGAELALSVSPPEFVPAKGFAEPVKCYRVRPSGPHQRPVRP